MSRWVLELMVVPPIRTTSVFSPRSSTDALEYYADVAVKANDGPKE